MQRIHRLIRMLRNNQYLASQPIDNWKMKTFIYHDPNQYQPLQTESQHQTVHIGDHLIDSGITAILSNKMEIPAQWHNEDVGLFFQASGPGGISSHYEGLFSINGEPIQGFDRNRAFCFLPKHLRNQKTLEIHIELFNPVGIPEDSLRGFNQVASAETSPPPIYLTNSKLLLVNRAIQSFLYTVETACKTLELLDSEDTRYHILYQSLEDIANEWKLGTEEDFHNPSKAEKHEATLKSVLHDLAGYREGTIRAIGQSHIDLAWLWPLKETIRKASRTFSTACTLLDEYEDFEYAQSQPQLFEYLKDYHPKVFERVKRHIDAGRFEIIGGMWVEPDLNIPSGESLVRQLLYGKQYFQKEFNQEPRVEWLPDTFGYCASLPQILKKADTDYFMTTKLNWNDTNRFPYDLFYWEGIDGTSILSYLHTILGQQTNPKDVKDTWQDYIQKKEYDERMLVYGFGDGGGGVTREMVETIKRSDSLPGLPNVKFSKVHDFFDRVTQKDPKLPKWYGDLYLELHRGTYTTHAKTKKYNRQAEALLRNVEIWNTFAHLITGAIYPAQKIKELWKLIMFNQFHDIVPGTSIEPVYKLSDQQYEEVITNGESLQKSAIEHIVQRVNTAGPGEPIIVFNSLGWDRSRFVTLTGNQELLGKEVVDEKGTAYPVEYVEVEKDTIDMHILIENVPSFGYKTVWLKEANEQTFALTTSFNGKWETAHYIVEFSEQGFMRRLYDKQADKEIIQEGKIANELELFDDLPTDWDAWDIDPNFDSQKLNNMEWVDAKVNYTGELTDELQFEWKLNQSYVTQRIIFYHHSKVIDFVTEVDWQETNKLLKVAFPVNIYSAKATYEIPFGSIERPTHHNTSWEQAQYEVCGQRWADLSEGNYGVSLLNDSKYGYDIKGKKMRLSLLRSPKWPDQNADRHTHSFMYSLYPHQGDWRTGQTVKKGLEVNTTDAVYFTKQHDGSLQSSQSFIQVDSDSAILDTIKQSEDEKGIIVRLYESEGNEVSTAITLPEKSRIQETNLLEKPTDSPSVSTDYYQTKLKPYEICTHQLITDKE
ncbi:alpha-mannosidase [Gracilibacillus sp. YIM 98692]|uniref:alpha-mannosidase n=1 Tax=Gracilibacillus sp. YIM 98692 TaxID=2663532 RepID=UPI0013D2AF92|nr:alpha-mannosidase [Gracilibacillus sp. YIM 98692]